MLKLRTWFKATGIVHWTTLPVVSAEKYLGLWFTADLSFTKQLRSSLSKGTALLNAVSPLLRDGRISARAKLDLIRMHLLPVVTYASEVWVPSSLAEKDIVRRLDGLLARTLKLAFKPSACGYGARKLLLWHLHRALLPEVLHHDCKMPSFTDSQSCALLRLSLIHI